MEVKTRLIATKHLFYLFSVSEKNDMASPLDHFGRAVAGALSGLAAFGDQARRRVDEARDAVASAVANAQQHQQLQRQSAMSASSATQRRRASGRPVGVAVRFLLLVSFFQSRDGKKTKASWTSA